MGELLDRGVQNHFLRALGWHYPNAEDISDNWQGYADNVVRVNLCYLEEHGLVRLEKIWPDDELLITDAKITARGLDFLQDDGGLGAILGVVTVKLADETIKQLLAAKVDASETDPGVKAKLLETIKGLPSKATEDIAGKLVDWAAAGVSIETLRAWLGV
ncbi:MAG: hypothetical protein ACK5V0_01145 [Alphaproteobacteria bacterium]